MNGLYISFLWAAESVFISLVFLDYGDECIQRLLSKEKKKWSSDLVSAQKYNINFPLFGPDDVISYSIKPL